jgi:hypothetical protein
MLKQPSFRFSLPFTNNPIESFNKCIKNVVTKYETVTCFQEKSIPSILNMVSLQAQSNLPDDFWTCDQKILIERYKIEASTLKLALTLYNDKENHMVLGNFLFLNSSRTLYYATHAQNQITTRRIETFLGILCGTIFEPSSWDDAKFNCNMHMCRMYAVANENFMRFNCVCKTFQTTSFVCSHVLVHMHLQGIINLESFQDTALKKIGRGRPKSTTTESAKYKRVKYGGLHVFHVDYLVGVVTKYTGSNWIVQFNGSIGSFNEIELDKLVELYKVKFNINY